MRLRRIEIRSSPIIHHSAGCRDRFTNSDDAILNFFADRGDRIVHPERDLVITQFLMTRSGQVEFQANTVEFVWSRHGHHAGLEVRRAARQRADHRKVRLHQETRQGVTARWQQAPCRLVSEDTAEMRRVSNRAADVRPRLEPAKTGRQSRRRAA